MVNERELAFEGSTPRPWRTCEGWIEGSTVDPDLDGAVAQGFGDERWAADAALIVRAVNLLEPLEAVAEAARRVAEKPISVGRLDGLYTALARLDEARK